MKVVMKNNLKGKRVKIPKNAPKNNPKWNNPNNGGGGAQNLSAWQKYRLRKMELKNKKLDIQTKQGRIRQIGKAVAEGSAPIAGSISANRTAEQIAASKRMSADSALNAWNNNISGNPDTENGQEGSKQGESSTTQSSAGTFRSVID